MAISVTAISVIPYGELAQSKQPLVDVVQRAAPWFPSAAFSLISLLAVTNTALLNYIMGSRLAYGMARHGLLPRFLGRVHAVRRTPHMAILVLMGIVTVLILAGDISVLAKATSVLLLTVFIVVNASLIVLKRRPTEPKGHFEVPTLVPVGGILISGLMLSNAKFPEVRIAVILLLAIAALYYVLKPKMTDEDLATFEK
jgi:basic amino acid/polyamine antiporter, APA family